MENRGSSRGNCGRGAVALTGRALSGYKIRSCVVCLSLKQTPVRLVSSVQQRKQQRKPTARQSTGWTMRAATPFLQWQRGILESMPVDKPLGSSSTLRFKCPKQILLFFSYSKSSWVDEQSVAVCRLHHCPRSISYGCCLLGKCVRPTDSGCSSLDFLFSAQWPASQPTRPLTAFSHGIRYLLINRIWWLNPPAIVHTGAQFRQAAAGE